MSILNSNKKLKKHLVHKKYKLLVEFSFKDNQCIINQKLNSFFGQIGIYEGADKLNSFIDLYFKSLFFDFKDFLSPAIFEKEDDCGANSSEIFFLQVTLYFYYAEKKCDFFINNIFKKNFFLDKNSINIVNNFLKSKQWVSLIISKFFYFFKLKERFFMLKTFKKSFKFTNKFYSLLRLNSIDFLKNDDKTYSFEDEIFRYKKDMKKRILFFKKMFNKSKNKIMLLLKKADFFFLKFVLNLILNKFLFINYYYNHYNFFGWFMNLFSGFYNIKNKLFDKFKRYKRFKKIVSRSLYGRKITYIKIYRNEFEKKNAKKKK